MPSSNVEEKNRYLRYYKKKLYYSALIRTIWWAVLLPNYFLIDVITSLLLRNGNTFRCFFVLLWTQIRLEKITSAVSA